MVLFLIYSLIFITDTFIASFSLVSLLVSFDFGTCFFMTFNR